jgi:hypothetical protein
MPQLQALGIDGLEAAKTAAALGHARARLEDRIAALLAHVILDATGKADIPHPLLLKAPRPLALQALAWLLQTVGERDYPPRGNALERLLDWMSEGPGRGRTLAGCRIRAKTGGFTISPETVGRPLRSVEGRPVKEGSATAKARGIKARPNRWRPRRPLIPGRFAVV